QRDIGKPRLAVDRAFILRGIGTIVTGTLAGGTLRRGQAVVVQPAKIPARIRTIQNHNREVEEIGPGARTALSVPDVAVAREKNTLAGGVVFDPDASVRKFRSAAQRELLAERAQAPHDAGVFTATEIGRDRAVKRNALLAKSSFGADEIAQSIKRANVIERGDLVVDAKWWNEVLRKAKAAIDV